MSISRIFTYMNIYMSVDYYPEWKSRRNQCFDKILLICEEKKDKNQFFPHCYRCSLSAAEGESLSKNTTEELEWYSMKIIQIDALFILKVIDIEWTSRKPEILTHHNRKESRWTNSSDGSVKLQWH